MDIYEWELENIEKLQSVKFVYLNTFYYSQGLVLFNHNKFHEIKEIVLSNENVYFLCRQLKCIGFNDFCNSFIVEKTENVFSLLNLNDLRVKKSYEIFSVDGTKNIIASTLDLKNVQIDC